MRVCLGIPLTEGVRSEVYFSHLSLATQLGRSVEYLVIPAVHGVFPHDRAREAIVDEAINSDCDYLFFLDSDMHPPRKAFEQLLATMQSTKAQMVAGHAYRRGYPYTPVWSMQVSDTEVAQVTADPGSVPEEIHSSGLSCNLIDVKWCREHLKRPWFYMGPYKKLPMIWEDAYFCKMIRDAGGKIIGDPSVRAGHLSTGVIVDDTNHDQLRKWYMQSRGEIS